MTRKFSLDLEDLYTDTDRVTRVTVYHDGDVVETIVDERGKEWKDTQLSARDVVRLDAAVIQEIQANRELRRE